MNLKGQINIVTPRFYNANRSEEKTKITALASTKSSAVQSSEQKYRVIPWNKTFKRNAPWITKTNMEKGHTG